MTGILRYNDVEKFGKSVTFQRPYRLIGVFTLIHMGTVGIAISYSFQNKGGCCDKQILIFTPTLLALGPPYSCKPDPFRSAA